MRKVSWEVKEDAFKTIVVYGELLGFIRGWFFTYAIVNPLDTHITGNLSSVWRNCPMKVRLSKIHME
jgi:hypothetical protein